MKFLLPFLAVFSIAMLLGNCASEEVKQPPQDNRVLEEPKPSKKPNIKEVAKKRERDIK